MLENIENLENRSDPQIPLSKQMTESTAEKQNNALKPSPTNSQNRPIKKLGKYQFSFDQRIGGGLSGDVYAGINTENNEIICIKIIDKQIFKTSEQKLLLDNQIRCQEACTSDYTVKIYDVFDTNSFCFIVTEFCQGGDLYKLIKFTKNGLEEVEAIKFGKNIVQALFQLKKAKIIHRDLKSENILLTKNKCKVGDFGFAIEEEKLGLKAKFNLGSPLYMSLEALESSQYSYSSDVFAFGAVMYEMLHKESPWECSDEKQLIQKMKTEGIAFKSGISEAMKSLISGCLTKEAKDRLTIEDIQQMELFNIQ